METTAAADANAQPAQLLGLAVERSYAVFAHNTLGPSMVVRRADITDDDVAALAGPIRSVPAAAIDRWLPHAVTTWGTAEDLRALVPRVFELLTAGLLATAPEVVFAKLRLADLAGWPIDEVGALDDIVGSLWLASLTQHPSATGVPASRLLTALAELGRDLSPQLDDWLLLLASGTPGAASARAHLRDLVQRLEALRALGLGVPALFWSPHPEEAARLETWLDSPVTQGLLTG